MPLALTGPPEIVLSSRPRAAAASQAVTLVLLAALSFAAAGLAVTVAEAALARGPILALLEALGLGPAGTRRMSAVEPTSAAHCSVATSSSPGHDWPPPPPPSWRSYSSPSPRQCSPISAPPPQPSSARTPYR
jgi:hypothetical protein